MIIIIIILIMVYLIIGWIATFIVLTCFEYRNYNSVLVWLFWPFVVGYIIIKEVRAGVWK